MTRDTRRGRHPPSGKGRGNWNLAHGYARRGARQPEFQTWAGMLARCRNPNSQDWENYGGRGIKVCDLWLSFENFIADMGPRPSRRHSIDRVNVNGHYEPGNCRWATSSEQARNRRKRQRQTHCKHGHPFAGDNLYIRKNGKQTCKTCRKLGLRRWYQKKRNKELTSGTPHGSAVAQGAGSTR